MVGKRDRNVPWLQKHQKLTLAGLETKGTCQNVTGEFPRTVRTIRRVS